MVMVYLLPTTQRCLRSKSEYRCKACSTVVSGGLLHELSCPRYTPSLRLDLAIHAFPAKERQLKLR